jgi:hypothetical protein
MKTVEVWIQALRRDSTFVWTANALNLIPTVTNKETRLVSLLMAFYLHRKIEMSLRWQGRFVLLMKEMFIKGHSANGLAAGRPVWLHILQLRFEELYIHLDRPNTPTMGLNINLSGYLGALVKLALQVGANGKEVSLAIQERQSPFDHRTVLTKVQPSSDHQVSIKNIFSLIESNPVPVIRACDAEVPYQVQIHPKLPKLHRYLIHESILNGHQVLLRRLIERSNKVLYAKDNWLRTPLHVAEIMEIGESVRACASQTDIQKMERLKDGFGRTPTQIAKWKQTRVHTEKGLHTTIQSENGGWNSEYLRTHQTSKREMDVVHYSELSWQRFQQDYASCGKPVLIRGVPNVTVLQQRWGRERFETKFADLPVEVGVVPYARSLGQAGGIKSFSAYRNSNKEYAFVQLHPKQHQSLLKEIPEMGYLSKLTTVHTQFYQGVAGTGAPMHLHIDAWNCLVYGQKRWFLASPFKGVYSGMAIKDWVNNIRPTMSETLFECTQQAGDVLYIPKYWSHAVLNTQECIGIAREFLNPYLS